MEQTDSMQSGIHGCGVTVLEQYATRIIVLPEIGSTRRGAHHVHQRDHALRVRFGVQFPRLQHHEGIEQIDIVGCLP